MGVLIGDGTISNQVTITNPDSEIIDKVKSVLPDDVKLIAVKNDKINYRITTGLYGTKKHWFREHLDKLGLYGKKSYEKHIPYNYLYSSVEDRIELLRGLMDSDGYIGDDSTCEYSTSSEKLSDDIMFLLRSLGGIPVKKIKTKTKYTYKNEVKFGRVSYRIFFSLKTFNPFYLSRKSLKWNPSPRDNGRWIDRIEFESKQKTVCISVDSPDNSYITDCFIVTHNTLMQLEWANQVTIYTGRPVLILAPLAVSGQTIREGQKFGIEVRKYDSSDFSIQITNYEQLDNIDCSKFDGIVCDESSILKQFTGKYKKQIIESFQATPYKLACTATPAPNDLNEIGNHAEFLDVMDSTDMRMRWFIRDEGMNNYRLKKHARKEFYGWIASWCSAIRTPADIGFAQSGFDLPPLNYFELKIETEKKDNGKLFNDDLVNATNFNKELRLTITNRMEKVVEIVNNSNEPFIVWVNLNTEADYIKRLIPEAIEVRGSESSEVKEKKLLGFANGDYRVLLTKKKIAQFGLNYQHCNNQIFATMDFSMESLYQAIRRSYRFGQKNEVNIYLVTVDTMSNVMEIINKKQKEFDLMMNGIIKEINGTDYKLQMDYEHKEYKTDDYHLINADCVEAMKNIPDNSVHLSIFSPPFSTLYTYSDNLRDMGNCAGNEEFLQQSKFMLEQLYRIIKPGRLVCVHTKDLAVYKNSCGYTGLYDFTADYHRLMESVGFKYHSKVTIWTDPVLEMQRTKTQRLLYKQVTSDSSYSGIGCPEYVTIFRKWEGNEEDWEPVTNLNKANFDLDTWQKWASPVWMDILRTDVLNDYRGARTEQDEKHICPLQLGVIERCIALWSNPGDIVFTPFMGIGSELYQAVKMGRKGIGIELKESYYNCAKNNLQTLMEQKTQMSILDMMSA